MKFGVLVVGVFYLVEKFSSGEEGEKYLICVKGKVVFFVDL